MEVEARSGYAHLDFPEPPTDQGSDGRLLWVQSVMVTVLRETLQGRGDPYINAEVLAFANLIRDMTDILECDPEDSIT